MKAFINSIETLIQKFGKSAVTEDRFFNMMKDVYDFYNNPDYFNALKAAYKNNAIIGICKSRKKNIKKVIEAKSDFICKNNNKQNKEVVKKVLFSYAIAINIISYEEYLAIENNTFITDSKFNFSRIWQSIDNVILINNVLFLCTSIVGIIVCLNSGWWPFFAILTVAISDIIYGCFSSEHLEWGNLTLSQKASVSACVCIGAIKTLSLFFVVSYSDASFLTYLLLILMLFVWGIFVISSEPFVYLKSKKGILAYCTNSLCLLLIIGGVLFYPFVFNSLNSLRNTALHIIRSYERADLGFGRYKLGSILVVNGSVNCDSIGIDECIANDSVHITLYTYNKKISRIVVEPISSWEGDYSYVEIFKEKYGFPENINDYYGNFYKSYYLYGSTLQWNYKNGSIILRCSLSMFEKDGIQSIEYISKEMIDINEKARLAAERKEREQAIIEEQKEKENLKNIEKEHLDKENQEKLKIQKTQQQIKEQI